MKTYNSTQEYINQNIAPGIGDIELTYQQQITIAQEMTTWKNGKLVEREDKDFFNTVFETIEN